MAPIKSSLAKTVGKLLGVFKDTDLSLRGDVQSTRYVPPPPAGIEATGGTITKYTSGGKYYRVHTFSHPNSDNFVVSTLSNDPSTIPNSVDYLIVGGGGAGGRGSDRANGGGGAGGFRVAEPGNPKTGTPITASVQTYPVTVGAGGAQSSNDPQPGGDSIIFSLTAAGGGMGGNRSSNDPQKDGGSGGGEAHEDPDNAGGIGNTPPVSPSQGSPGGTGYNSGDGSSVFGGGGGGGAGGNGQNSPDGSGSGDGGNGHPSGITGTTVIYAGGGGGGSQPNSNPYPGGAGGPGGGGAGAGTGQTDGVDGTDGLGGGGGGAQANGTAGTGGSGVVIVRYEIGETQYTA